MKIPKFFNGNYFLLSVLHLSRILIQYVRGFVNKLKHEWSIIFSVFSFNLSRDISFCRLKGDYNVNPGFSQSSAVI